MLVIGLTGSIGMGKSTIASQFAALGAKVSNADDIVHRLLGQGGMAVPFIEKLFPACVKDGAVNRKALGDIVFADKKQLKALEAVLHPLVALEEMAFVARQRRLGVECVVMDIPLLFEVGAQSRCDITLTVTAPAFLQRQRVLKRPGMTEMKFKEILASQLPDAEKRRRADFVVQTGLGRAASFKACKTLMDILL